MNVHDMTKYQVVQALIGTAFQGAAIGVMCLAAYGLFQLIAFGLCEFRRRRMEKLDRRLRGHAGH